MSMQEKYETTRDNLFAASQIMPVVTDKLKIAQAGVVKRGTLVSVAGAAVKKAEEVYAVLAEDVDTTTAAKDAAVYLTGEFNENALIVGTPDEGSLEAKDCKAEARKSGIFIKPSIR